jgi:phosphatidylglycerophosphate synthase
VFVLASASDGIDGWVARRFNQRSDFGAFIDPLADKSLLLVAVLVLWWVDWGADGWSIPGWYAALVVARDAVILGGITVLYGCRKSVRIAPSWSGKICTVLQMTVLGWVMLGWVSWSPNWPCALSALAIVWSGVDYIRHGWGILQGRR